MLRMLMVPLAAAALATPAAAQASVKITWPRAAVFNPGTRFHVKIASTERVRVALIRQGAGGKSLGTVTTRTLRSGTFTAALPDAGRYALQVTAGKRRWLHKVSGAYTGCAPAVAQTTSLRLETTTVPRGGKLPYEFVNTGGTCSLTGVGYGLEHRLDDGSWAALNLGLIYPSVGNAVGPGKSRHKEIGLPADIAPGVYRLVDTGVTAQFEVVP